MRVDLRRQLGVLALAALAVWSLPVGGQPAGVVASEVTSTVPPTATGGDGAPSVSAIVTEGRVSGGVRNYVMVTSNSGELQDWASWGMGAQLGWQSGRFLGLGFGMRFYSGAELAGNAFALDPTTGRPSRYELGLYDATARAESEVALLGEVYVDYERRGHRAWIGRHLLKSPLINPQDGRMIPTLVQGVWYEGAPFERAKVQLGYLSHIAPRSTPAFYSVADTLGLYPSGRTIAGQPADYAGNVDSAGIFVASVGLQGKLFRAEVWDYVVENVFNTVYVEAGVRPTAGALAFFFDGQVLAQQRLGDGGSAVAGSNYFEQHDSLVLGARAGAETRAGWRFSVNGNWITSDGRFLFPREWGKEPLFVFQKRERSEGSGDQKAVLLELEKNWVLRHGGKLKTKVGYGQYLRPPVLEPEFNKYALPSLWQANLETEVSFGGPLSGLSLELLVVYKGALEDGLDNPNFVLNKVDMMNWNFILDYAF